MAGAGLRSAVRGLKYPDLTLANNETWRRTAAVAAGLRRAPAVGRRPDLRRSRGSMVKAPLKSHHDGTQDARTTGVTARACHGAGKIPHRPKVRDAEPSTGPVEPWKAAQASLSPPGR